MKGVYRIRPRYKVRISSAIMSDIAIPNPPVIPTGDGVVHKLAGTGGLAWKGGIAGKGGGMAG